MRAISERFRDKELIIKRYINPPSFTFTLHFRRRPRFQLETTTVPDGLQAGPHACSIGRCR